MINEELFRGLVELRRAVERVHDLSLSPEPETVLKILELQEFLKKGFSMHRALKAVGLGWRSYYKHALVIYMDPELHIPLPKDSSGTTAS